MPSYQYPRSLVAQFPEDVYRNAGASDVLPLVMKNLDADKVLAVQFLRAGRVRLTFQDSETCSQVLKEGLDFGDFSVDLLPADDRLSTSETFQLRSRKKLSLVSLPAMEKFCLSVTVSSMTTLMFGMVTGWPKYFWTVIFRSLPKLMDATVVSGIRVNRLNVQYAESLAIVPRPVHSLVVAGAVALSLIHI